MGRFYGVLGWGLKLTIALRAGRPRVHFLATMLWLPVSSILVPKYGW